MSTAITSTFTAAARCFAELVDEIPSSAWTGPGLGDWDLRSLVGHTSRSLSTVISYLQQPAEQVQVASTAEYYDEVARQISANPDAVAERGRQAGIALGDEPAHTINTLVQEALAALDAVHGDPVIDTIAGGMQLSEYLPTRTFELTVHTLDIAVARGRIVTPPATALEDALRLVTELATRRGEGSAVLLALTGRTPLPDGYSVV